MPKPEYFPRIFRSALCLYLLLCAFLPAHTVEAGGRILRESMATTQKQPVPLHRIHPGEPGETARPHENLLDSLDVYSLSPDARLLVLPRMITPQLARRIQRPHAPAIPWQEIIHKASARYGLSPALIAAVIATESGFSPVAESPKGAQGPMQIMPGTQKELGLVDPYDPEANVLAGTRYLSEQLQRFGSLELALAAYNAGPGNVLRHGGIPPFPETRNYVRRVLRRIEQSNF